MSLGTTLRQARVARKLTTGQVSSATRIAHRIIVAMEQDEWSKVPGGIFARGYLRAYAREVGLDGTELAAQFDAENAPPPEVPENQAIPQADASRPIVRIRLPALSEAASRWVTGSAMVALLLFVYVAGRWSTADDQPAPPPAAGLEAAAPTSALGAPPPVQPVGTSAASADEPAAAGGQDVRNAAARAGDVDLPGPAADSPIVAAVAVTRPCWVTASADGVRTIYRTLQPGERVEARGRVLTLRVGDAGALRLSLEGEAAGPLGASGEVVSLRITRENYRSLLPAKVGN